MLGDTDHARESPVKNRLPRPARNPRNPETLTWGNRLAPATLAAQWPRLTFVQRNARRAAAAEVRPDFRWGEPWRLRILARCEVRIEFAGARPGEDRQSYSARDTSKFKDGIEDSMGCHAGGGTRDVLFFTHARVTAELREPQRFTLVHKTPFGYRQAPLRTPELEIIAGELSDHTDLRIVKVGLDRLILSSRCRNSVTNSSE